MSQCDDNFRAFTPKNILLTYIKEKKNKQTVPQFVGESLSFGYKVVKEDVLGHVG